MHLKFYVNKAEINRIKRKKRAFDTRRIGIFVNCDFFGFTVAHAIIIKNRTIRRKKGFSCAWRAVPFPYSQRT